MRWGRRASIDPPPATLPRLDRERAALARLATATDDAALAEWARLRLRASDFVAAHATPTPAAVDAAAARDDADEPIDLAMPSPLPHVDGATLVDVAAKLPALDRLAAMNAPRHAVEADVHRTEMTARAELRAPCVLTDAPASTAREVAWIDRVEKCVAIFLVTLFGLLLTATSAICLDPSTMLGRSLATAWVLLALVVGVELRTRVHRRSAARRTGVTNGLVSPPSQR